MAVPMWIDELCREMFPLRWAVSNLDIYRCNGVLSTTVKSAFPMSYDLPIALVRAEVHQQQRPAVGEAHWRAVNAGLANLVETKRITARVPLRAINQIYASRSRDRRHVRFKNIDEFGAFRSGKHPQRAVEDLAAAAIERGGNLFTFTGWNGIMCWDNHDGSHRMAAAIHDSRVDGIEWFVDAVVRVQTLKPDVVAALSELVAIFLMPGDPLWKSSRHIMLCEALPHSIPWRSAAILYNGRPRRALLLPLCDRRAAALARKMRARLAPNRREVVETLGLLARWQHVPGYLEADKLA